MPEGTVIQIKMRVFLQFKSPATASLHAVEPIGDRQPDQFTVSVPVMQSIRLVTMLPNCANKSTHVCSGSWAMSASLSTALSVFASVAPHPSTRRVPFRACSAGDASLRYRGESRAGCTCATAFLGKGN